MSASVEDLRGKYWFDSWQSKHGTHNVTEECPGCGESSWRCAITKLVYEFAVCTCGKPSYGHLVEQLWHRHCFANAHRTEIIGEGEMWNVVAAHGSEEAVKEAVEVVARLTPDASPEYFSKMVVERVPGARVGPLVMSRPSSDTPAP